MRESSVGEEGSSYKLAIARTRAAKPAAEDARPAAVGKLFSETIFRGKEESFGREGSEASRTERRERNSRKQAWVRAPVTSWGEEFRRRESEEGKDAEQAAVVWVRRSAWERVTEIEELVGRLRAGSRFPQYLLLCENCVLLFRGKEGFVYFTTAILTGAVVLAWYTLSAIVIVFMITVSDGLEM